MKCKQKILIKDKKGYVRRVPCGQCTACRLNRSREWSWRVCREAELYDDVCFLTLTYDDEHLPDNRSLVRSHPQDFLKLLRRHIEPRKLRFFGCGEYGGQTERPHYHIILFGISPFDDVFEIAGYDKAGAYGRMCEWPCGNVHVKSFSLELADYTAQYVLKKQTGILGEKEYQEQGRLPPFLMFSNRPGIGAYVLDDKSAVALMNSNGFVWHKGKKCSIPRYYVLRGVGLSDFDRLVYSVSQDKKKSEKFKELRENGVKDAYRRVYGKTLDASEHSHVMSNENRKFEKRRNKC